MAGEEEEGFTFVDKRRAGTGASEPSPAPSSVTEASPEQLADEPSPLAESDSGIDAGEHGHPDELPALGMRDRLLMCIDILYQGAWIALGLVADPATHQIEQDLPRAKTAIDSVAFLAERVEPELEEEIQRELKRMVADLRMNYVQRAGK
jgi:hypothetical protein